MPHSAQGAHTIPAMIQVLTALLFVFCGGAFAAPPAVTLRLVASGLTLPVEIAHAGDASGRLFVVEQGGAIKIIKDGAVLATPFRSEEHTSELQSLTNLVCR